MKDMLCGIQYALFFPAPLPGPTLDEIIYR